MTDAQQPEAYPDVPMGTVTCFAGDCSNSATIGRLARAGWMPCDGSLLQVNEYPELYAVIGISHGGQQEDGIITRFNVPNMNSCFARGVNGAAVNSKTGKTIDPDVEARVAANPMGNAKNYVGSYQFNATGLPVVPFVTDVTGDHKHVADRLTSSSHKMLDGASFYQAWPTDDSTTVAAAGLHAHTVVVGGDVETRPVSLSLYFIIKFI